MKRLLVAAMLLAIGAGVAQAADAGGQLEASRSAEPGVWTSSDASYGKQLASQYNTANGE